MKFGFPIALLGLILVSGCAKVPPPVTEVEGLVLMDEKPVPMAYIEFVPQLANFGAEMNSTALSDDDGKFLLKCNHKGLPGAVVAKHWVLVTDGTPQPATRPDERDPDRNATPTAQLPNRPIPAEYGSVGSTPLKIDVTKDNKTYVLKLTRKS
jgi:hypothetical protein